MLKVVQFRFQQCLVPLTMMLVQGSSETGLFRHLFKNVFGVGNFGNRSAMSFIFFFKMFKISSSFQKFRIFFLYQIIESELGVLNYLY